MNLPEWASLKLDEDGKPTTNRGGMPIVVVDGDAAYEAWAEELEIKKLDDYWKEVLYQCVKMDVQLGLKEHAFNSEIHIKVKDKAKWRLKDPEGDAVKKATRGRDAREHFKRRRGVIPGAG